MSKTAHIVAVRRRDVQPLVGAGIMGRSAVDLLMLVKPWIGPRPDLEDDTDFLQLIPYIVIKRGDKYLAYTRGTAGGEDRLHGKISIGVGGHVDADDVCSSSSWTPEYMTDRTLYAALRRELEEEVGRDVSDYVSGYISGMSDPRLIFTHVIHLEATDVDKVHLGAVAIIEIPEDMQLEFEDTMENADWYTLDQLNLRSHRLENWSAILVDALSQGANQS